MMLSSKYLLLGSALIGHVLSAALPWDHQEEDIFDAPLQARQAQRGEDDWTPPGAPPIHPGQNIHDYLKNILGGVGDPTNPLPISSKQKREYSNLEYVDGDYNSTTRWVEDGNTYEITVIDGLCPHGIKPSTLAGPLITYIDNVDKENATVRDIIDSLYDIRKAHRYDVDAREVATAEWHNKQALKLYGELNSLLDAGWICDSVDPTQPIALHDELRRKLLEMNKVQYYTFILAVATGGGAIVAGVQAGITHAYANVELGAEAYFNSAVGIALSIFIACEASRFAPRIAGAESWSPVVLYAWGRRFVTRSGQALKRARSSAGQTLGGAVTGSAGALANAGSSGTQLGGGGASTQSLPGCVGPDQARLGAENLMEQGYGSSSGALQNAMSLGYQAASDTANIAAGEHGVGACRD